eukprot:2595940-Pyramimonas_sp.AAC.1
MLDLIALPAPGDPGSRPTLRPEVPDGEVAIAPVGDDAREPTFLTPGARHVAQRLVDRKACSARGAHVPFLAQPEASARYSPS